MLPAALHYRNLGIEKMVHGAFEDVGFGHEIGVEDHDQLALGSA